MTPNPVPSIPSREAVPIDRASVEQVAEMMISEKRFGNPTRSTTYSISDLLLALLAEVERLTERLTTAHQVVIDQGKVRDSLRATVSAQAAELEKVRKDSERYRWLKSNCVQDESGDYVPANRLSFGPYVNNIDTAIDAALAQSASQMDATHPPPNTAPPHSSG